MEKGCPFNALTFPYLDKATCVTHPVISCFNPVRLMIFKLTNNYIPENI